MADYIVRPVSMIDESPGLVTRGARVKIASGADFIANNLVKVANGEASTITTGDNAGLAFVEEPAINKAYVAEGTDYDNTKTEVEVRFIGGKRIAMTLTGTYTSASIGAEVGVALDASGYAVADASQANKIGIVEGVYGNQILQSGNNAFLQDNVKDNDTNVYVIVRVYDAVALG